MKPSNAVLLIVIALFLQVYSPDAAIDAAMPAQWRDITLQHNGDGVFFAASSTLESAGANHYGPDNLFDDNPNTCWCEGKPDDGIGEAIFVAVEKGSPALFFRNGYTKRADLFEKNNRIRTFAATLFQVDTAPPQPLSNPVRLRAKPVAGPFSLTLADQMAVQRVALPFDWQLLPAVASEPGAPASDDSETLSPFRYVLQLGIADIYSGSRYNDTCLSDMWLTEKTERIYVNDAEDAVLLDTNMRKGVILVQDETAVFRLLDQTPDRKWLIAYKTPRHHLDSGAGMEEMLFHVGLRRQINLDELLDGDAIQLFGLENNALSFGKLPYNKVSTIDLDILERMVASSPQ